MPAASMWLIQTATLKSEGYMGISGATQDTILGALIGSVSAAIEAYCGRYFKLDDYTEVLNRWENQTFVQLHAFPVTAVTSIKTAQDWDFASATAIDTDDYDVDLATGIVRFKHGVLETGPRSLQVVYNGGLEALPASIETNHPVLSTACYLTVNHIFQRKDEVGEVTESIANMAATARKAVKIPEIVKQILLPYRTAEVLC